MSIDNDSGNILASTDDQKNDDSKRRMWLLRLLLKTDFRNPKIWSELTPSKKSLLQNMKDNVVPLSDINAIFWTYISIDKDIPVHRFLKPRLVEYSVKCGEIILSVADYLSLLHITKTAFAPIKSNFDHWRKLALIALNSEDTSWTEFDHNEHKEGLSKNLDNLYQRTYLPKFLKKQEEDLLLYLDNGNLSFYDVVYYVALFSYFPNEKGHISKLLDPYLEKPLDTGLSVSMTVYDTLEFLSELDISSHLYKKL